MPRDFTRVEVLSIRENQLEPELTLPIQVPSNDGGRCQGERNLCFELLAGALHDLDSPVIAIREAAESWLLRGSIGQFTARDTCDYLGVSWLLLRDKVQAGMKLLRSRRDSSGIHNRVVFPSHAMERAPTRDKRFLNLPLFGERES